MKATSKVKTIAQEQPKAKAPKAAKTEQAISIGQITLICKGKAAVTFTAPMLDGRFRGWLCKPDGTRVEKMMVADLAEAEARAQALLDKGAL